MDASVQERLRDRQAADFVCQYVHQFGLSIWTAVGQGALEVIPHAFIRERCHFFALDIVLIELAVQCTMEAFRTDSDTRDGRDPIMTIPMNQDRCLSHRTPGLTDRGDQEEARFVDKDDMGCQPCGVFLHGARRIVSNR